MTPHPTAREGAEGEACREPRSWAAAAEGDACDREDLPNGGAAEGDACSEAFPRGWVAEGEVASREPLPNSGAAVAGDACSEALPLPFTPLPPAIATFPMEVERDGDVPDR